MEKTQQVEKKKSRSIAKDIVAILGIALSGTILIAPSAIPDVIPFIGFIDEAIATTILLGCLSHFGLDLTGFLKKK